MSESSGGRIKTWISELHSRVTDSVDLSCRLKVCVLYKFPLDAEDADPGTTH